jgi:methylase of polypeptide subunit release factors
MFGFDVIVGNPPYVRPHNIPEREKRYLWDNFESIEAKSDLYACFVEKVNSLLKNK